MKSALGVLCVFTILAVVWLGAMFLLLHHPGYQWRAAMCLPIIAQSVATVFALRPPASTALRAATAAGAVFVGAFAGWAFVQNARDASFEGYLAIISAALVCQAVLTLYLARRPSASRRGSASRVQV